MSLNVWTTNLDGRSRQPVMVWLHGGAFMFGSGGEDAAVLAPLGVVVVTVNYRLGLLASLAHPALAGESPHGSSGTYAVLDQIEALRWVRRNIAAFGGDPARVTVLGHSAGGAAVLHLLASPLAKGLFQRAIAQSGGLGELRPRGDAEAAGQKIAETLVGSDPDPIAALRRVRVDRLMASGRPPCGPISDGWVLPEPVPASLFGPGASTVPLIVGATANEAVVFEMARDLKAYRETLAHAGPTFGTRLSELYPATTDLEAYAALLRYDTDRDFVCPARYVASRRSAATWLYRVSAPPAAGSGAARLGAYHGADVRYLFRVEMGVPLSAAAARVGEAMRRYWVRFAATGDPTHPSLESWPAYARVRPQRLELGDPVRAESALDNRGCDVFDSITDHFVAAGADIPARVSSTPPQRDRCPAHWERIVVGVNPRAARRQLLRQECDSIPAPSSTMRYGGQRPRW